MNNNTLNNILDLCDSKRSSEKSEWRRYLLKTKPEKENKTILKDAMKKIIIKLQDGYRIVVKEDISKYRKIKNLYDKTIESNKSNLGNISEMNKEIAQLKARCNEFRFIINKYENCQTMESKNHIPRLGDDSNIPIGMDKLKESFTKSKTENENVIPTFNELKKDENKFINDYKIDIDYNFSYPCDIKDLIESQRKRDNKYKKRKREECKSLKILRDTKYKQDEDNYGALSIQIRNIEKEISYKLDPEIVNDFISTIVKELIRHAHIQYKNEQVNSNTF
tara:strand:+ start:1272 stop:2108 length:837 start_codon:yes stop_codon:yes gene_type:complete